MKQEDNKIPMLVISTILFGVLMNFPILSVANKVTILIGFPVLYLFLFVVWAVFIFVIYLIVHKK